MESVEKYVRQWTKRETEDIYSFWMGEECEVVDTN
jgi:hypothetical protein